MPRMMGWSHKQLLQERRTPSGHILQRNTEWNAGANSRNIYRTNTLYWVSSEGHGGSNDPRGQASPRLKSSHASGPCTVVAKHRTCRASSVVARARSSIYKALSIFPVTLAPRHTDAVKYDVEYLSISIAASPSYLNYATRRERHWLRHCSGSPRSSRTSFMSIICSALAAAISSGV